MKANPDNIWRVPAYLPYLQPDLTDEAIAAAEQRIGFELPQELLNLLHRQNGGYIRFSLPDTAHDVISGIGPHFPSLTNYDLDECQEYVSFPLHGLVPFDGDGHWHLCLDYRQNATSPAVAYIDVECDEQRQVADSFADYLGMLRIQFGNDYVLESIQDIEDAIARLSFSLGITFDPPDSWAHGYPTYRAALGSTDRPEWLWISPNDVPRGFVRTDDPRYDELKDRLPGQGKRHPSLPDGSYILSTTDGVHSKVVKACSGSGLTIRLLKEYIDDV